MKVYFKSVRCRECGRYNDVKLSHCSRCGRDLENPDAEPFSRHLHFPIWKEVVFFVLAMAGLTIVATIVQLIQSIVIGAQLGLDTTAEEALKILMSPDNLCVVEFLSYGTIFAVIAVLIWSQWKEIGKSFKNWRTYAFGAAGFAAILGFEYLYSIILTLVCKAIGIEAGSNNNQNTIVALIQYAPVLCMLFFGVIGPFVEEFAYRVGLFGLGSRLGKPLGYILTVLVFALIHFDFGSAFNFGPDNFAQAVLEWLNLPIYMFSGLAFTFLYDKFGFGASCTAHTLNNVFSIGMSIIEQHLPQQ